MSVLSLQNSCCVLRVSAPICLFARITAILQNTRHVSSFGGFLTLFAHSQLGENSFLARRVISNTPGIPASTTPTAATPKTSTIDGARI
jgi:hypothetical protein